MIFHPNAFILSILFFNYFFIKFRYQKRTSGRLYLRGKRYVQRTLIGFYWNYELKRKMKGEKALKEFFIPEESWDEKKEMEDCQRSEEELHKIIQSYQKQFNPKTTLILSEKNNQLDKGEELSGPRLMSTFVPEKGADLVNSSYKELRTIQQENDINKNLKKTIILSHKLLKVFIKDIYKLVASVIRWMHFAIKKGIIFICSGWNFVLSNMVRLTLKINPSLRNLINELNAQNTQYRGLLQTLHDNLGSITQTMIEDKKTILRLQQEVLSLEREENKFSKVINDLFAENKSLHNQTIELQRITRIKLIKS